MDTQAQPKLEVARRTETGKGAARRLRAEGHIPAVCYGTTQEPVSLALDPKAMMEMIDTHPLGRNVVFRLDFGDMELGPVMLKDYQRDPVRRHLLHVDFELIDMTREVTVRVPLSTVGRAAGVRMGGKLTWLRSESMVSCLPAQIPAEVVIDVSDLGPGETVMASDLELPEGVSAGFRNDFGVVRVVMPRKNKQDAEVEAEAAEG